MATINRNSRIQVLYSDENGVTPDNGQLYNGEFAWAYGDNGGDIRELYIGGGDSFDVTFVGAEILRSGDTPFSEGGLDNKIATTKAIYDYVDNTVGEVDAGVISVDGVTGAVDLRGGDFISITPGTHPNKGITLSVLYDNDTLGLTLTDKLGVKDGGIGTTQLADSAVTNAKILNSTIGNSKLVNSGVTIVAGAGLTSDTEAVDLGGTLTLNILASTGGGLIVNADNIGLKNSSGLSNNHFLLWDASNKQLKDSPIEVSGPNINLDAGYSLSVGGTLEVDGNLIVSGNFTTLDVTRVEVEDPIIFLGATSGAPTARDVGFVAKSTGNTYSGLIRESTDGVFYLFDTDEDLSSSNSFTSGDATIKELRAHIVAGTFSAS